MILFLFIIFFIILVFWFFGGRELNIFSVFLCFSFLFGFALVLYLWGGSYDLGRYSDLERERLDGYRLMVLEDGDDLTGWLGLLEYYFAVGDFVGGGHILDGALIYHGDNERLLELKRYLDSR